MPNTATNPTSGASRKSGIAPGYIAVAVIAGVFGIAFIFGCLWLCWRRKQSEEDRELHDGTSRAMQRNTSVHSKAGLLANRPNLPALSTRQSSNVVLTGSDPASPLSMSERRKSQPLMYDQRLNPNALMSNDNGSHTSLQTLDDHRDYGRMLKVRPRVSYRTMALLTISRL